jgi:zinc protease
MGTNRSAIACTFALGLATLGAVGCGGPPAAAAPSGTVKVPLHVYELTLPNGLVMILDEDHRSPVVSVNVTYHVGGKDDPPHRSGFAHLFEHLMFEGSAHVAKGDFARYLEGAGVRTFNGSTTHDRTVYEETVPSNQLDLVLWLESDRMGFLLERLDQANFERERNVVKNEWRERYEGRELGFEWGFIYQSLFPGEHPYQRPAIGTVADLDAASLDDVRAFWSTFYVPSNATISIVGDFAHADAEAAVKRYFGGLRAAPRPPIKHGAMPSSLRGEKRLTVEAPVPDRLLTVAWATPAEFSADEPAARVALATTSSLLWYWLKDEHHYATAVDDGQSPGELAGVSYLTVALAPTASPDKVLELIDMAFSDDRQAEVQHRWVSHVVNHDIASLIYAWEATASRASLFGEYQQATGNSLLLARLIDRTSDVSRSDMLAAKTKYFTHDRVATLVVPTPTAPRPGRLVEGRKW